MTKISIRIPIELRIRIGDPEVVATVVATSADVVAARRQADPGPEPEQERFFLDEDYASRAGYDPDFLGFPVPLPKLKDGSLALASRDEERKEDNHILRYHKFSVVNNKRRRMCFFAACNLTKDRRLQGTWSRKELSGGGDRWILDPRIPANHQVTTGELYGPLEFDRGHIVRRDDVYWGTTETEAQYANFDTFHYTNCTPQHPRFNRSSLGGLWGKLENHLAAQSEDHGQNLAVFSGPRFMRGDPQLQGVKIPRQYWKVVVACAEDGGVQAWAFLLSQWQLVHEEKQRVEQGEEGFSADSEGFGPGALSTFQVSLPWLEARLDLTFPLVLHQGDTWSGNESVEEGPLRLETLEGLGGA